MDPAVSRAISNSSAIFFNGFIFDELEDAAVRAALNSAKENSTAVFFTTISSLAFKKSKKKSSCYGVFHADMQLTSNAVFTLLRN
jgi:peroxiredoxin family protein